MNWDKILYLVKETKTTNDAGDTITKDIVKRKVFGDIKSVSQTEHWQAQASGGKPEIKFILHYLDYKGEKTILYNSKTYNVIRNWSGDEETIELVCSSTIGG